MPAQQVLLASDVDVQLALERQIIQRTWGRIHRLVVELTADRAVIRGWTSSYYVKQLALAAVREVVEALPVELDIQVGGSEFHFCPTAAAGRPTPTRRRGSVHLAWNAESGRS
jgi:hypothetical protein